MGRSDVRPFATVGSVRARPRTGPVRRRRARSNDPVYVIIYDPIRGRRGVVRSPRSGADARPRRAEGDAGAARRGRSGRCQTRFIVYWQTGQFRSSPSTSNSDSWPVQPHSGHCVISAGIPLRRDSRDTCSLISRPPDATEPRRTGGRSAICLCRPLIPAIPRGSPEYNSLRISLGVTVPGPEYNRVRRPQRSDDGRSDRRRSSRRACDERRVSG